MFVASGAARHAPSGAGQPRTGVTDDACGAACRVFEYSTGHPVAVMHHFGKNPYGALDPLELSGTSNDYDHVRAPSLQRCS